MWLVLKTRRLTLCIRVGIELIHWSPLGYLAVHPHASLMRKTTVTLRGPTDSTHKKRLLQIDLQSVGDEKLTGDRLTPFDEFRKLTHQPHFLTFASRLRRPLANFLFAARFGCSPVIQSYDSHNLNNGTGRFKRDCAHRHNKHVLFTGHKSRGLAWCRS